MNNSLSNAVSTSKNNNVSSTKKRLPTFLKAVSGLALATCMANALAAVPAVTTQGNQVLFGGQQGSVAGNSFFWGTWGFEAFYNASAISWVHTDWNSKLIRAAIPVHDGSTTVLNSPDKYKALVATVVDAAVANDMYVLIDWHTHHAEYNPGEAESFFREMAQKYKNTPNVIFEIFNEPWDNVYWDSTIKPYAERVIGAIRGTGSQNLIIVGTRSWSQEVVEAANNPIRGYANIAYTLHFYAGSHKQSLRDKGSQALSMGIPLFVTEWGSVDASGDGAVNSGETYAWVDWMKRNNISNANWALGNKGEGSSALVTWAGTTGNWTSNQLTASGALAKDIVSHWSQAGGGGGGGGGSGGGGGGGTGGGTGVIPGNCSTVAVGTAIQAESFCNAQGIQTETTSDAGGGSNVGYIDAGDWMSYDIDVPAAGSYTVTYRVASMNGGGAIKLEKAGGNPVYGEINVPSTGGWQTWVNVSHTVQLSAGKQTIGLAAKAGGFNINWLKVESNGSGGGGGGGGGGSGAEIALVQAENFAAQSGVKTEGTSDAGGGSNVGYIDAGDWMSYTNVPVSVPTSGTYTIEFRVASQNGGKLSFEEAGGNPVYSTVSIPATGGWQNWTSVKATVNLSAGTHKFGIGVPAGGWNINWFRITQGAN